MRAGHCGALAAAPSTGRDPGSLARDLEARARELMIVQALGEIPSELSLTPEADAARWRARPSACRARPVVCACSS